MEKDLRGQFFKASAMSHPVRNIIVIGEDQAGVDFEYPVQTGLKILWTTIKNGRGKVNLEKVAGEQIAGKQKIMFFAVESAVAFGMAGKMNNLKASPKWQKRSF